MWLGLGAVVVGVVLVVISVVTGGNGGDGSTATSVPALVLVGDGASATTAPTTPEGFGGTVPLRDGRAPLRGFGEVSATITSESGEVCQVCMLAAFTAAQRERGLMEVTDEDLGGYDAMVFEYPQEVDGAFWMRNTPMPLSIAYFDADGELVSTADMEPCDDSATCPGYPPAQPFQYAVEVPRGMLDEIGIDGQATLRIGARTCSPAGSGG